MGIAKLFVKSTRVPVVRYEMPDIPGHYCQAGYRTLSTMISFSPDDEQAKKVLARASRPPEGDSPRDFPAHICGSMMGVGNALNNGMMVLVGVLLLAGGVISFFSGLSNYMRKTSQTPVTQQ